MRIPKGIDPEGSVAAYTLAMRGLNADCIKAVVERLIRGEVERFMTFCPTPPELAKLVRDEAASRVVKDYFPQVYKSITPPFKIALERAKLRADEIKSSGGKLVFKFEKFDEFASWAKKNANSYPWELVLQLGEVYSFESMSGGK